MREALRVHIPVWSAPSSGFSSPTCSPRRYCSEEFTATRNSKCLGAVEGQSHQRLGMDSSAMRPEGSNVNVHPLPLPPGTPSSGQPANSCHGKGKQDVSPMRSPWRKGKLIGGGTYGSVYMGINCETGALCAIKEVNLIPDDPNSAESIKQLEQEIKLLSQLKHPNIVQYYGSEKVEDRLDIHLEYVYPGSISKYIRELCGAIPESVVRHFTCHILSGLAYLHSMNTVHRDVKGANLLVDASGTVKLADFGLAKHLRGQLAELSLKGSPHWMAPELMQAVMQKGCSSDLAFAVDIWSLGCTIIEMVTGRPPWAELTGASAMFKALNGSPPIPETLSPEGKDFLSCCFRRNPAERPSAVMLLEHPFLRNLHEQRSPFYFRALSQLTCQFPSHQPVFCGHRLSHLNPFSGSFFRQ
ncbi:Protein kinase domain, partial [Dillenia turbinata]